MTDTSFAHFAIPAKLKQALTRVKFTSATPIQAQTLPMALQGRDILGSAQTGTGKTAAFGIPIIAKILDEPMTVALVLTPTRELATQVLTSIAQYIPTSDIRTALLIGGEPMQKQLRQLKDRPNLVVGTPGRVNDHLQRGTLKLRTANFLVLDETDRMLDMGFGVQIDKIVQHMPKSRQTLMFSATIPPEIMKMAGKYLNNPERVSVGSTTKAAPNIKEELIQVSETEKMPKLLETLDAQEGTTIIFVKTKFGTEKLAKKLVAAGHKTDCLHGDLRQNKRDRVVQNFRDKKFRILVATDVAARGLDVSHIELVVNYDLPQAPEDYIHRIGRTARAGASGMAVNLLTPADKAKWRAIHKLMHPDQKIGAEFNGGGDSRDGKRGGGFKKKSYSSQQRGRSFGNRSEQGEGRTERTERASERPARSFDRPERGERTERSERPVRSYDRAERSDRPARADGASADRKPWTNKDRAERGERTERPARSEGGYKPRGEGRSEGGYKKPFGKPAFKGPRSEERGERSERPARTERTERSERPARSADSRPAERTERTSERPAGAAKPFKKHFGKKSSRANTGGATADSRPKRRS